MRSCLRVALILFAFIYIAKVSFAEVLPINHSYPVMPNSIFQSTVDSVQAPQVEVTLDSLEESGKNSLRREKLLDGIWKYKPDPDEIGEEETWFSKEYNHSNGKQMDVPSNYSIEDPELSEFYKPVWFRRWFQVPQEWFSENRRFELIFEGVDYFAKVWVNGQELQNSGEHEGYFSPFTFDLDSVLEPGKNLIVVKVTNPYDYGLEQIQGNIFLNLTEKIWIKGVLNFWDVRPGDSLSPFESQSMGTGGIHDSVRLIATGEVSVDWVFITTKLSNNYESADVYFEYVLNNHTGEQQEILLKTKIEGKNFSAPQESIVAEVLLNPGPNSVQLVWHTENPALWWPATHPELGEPNVYVSKTSVRQGGSVLDRRSESFGIREVKMEEEGEAPYIWYVNGKRIFFRGTNYLPTEWFAEASEEDIRRDFELLIDSNIDMIRIASHISLPEVLELADEMGITIYQDFPLQWEYSVCDFVRYNGDPTLTNNAEVIEKMIAEMIYLHYNHPSVFLWTLHNEPFHFVVPDLQYDPENPIELCSCEPYSEDNPNWYPADLTLNKHLDQDHIMPVAEGIEHSRPIHMASGLGDTHLYDGWYQGLFSDAFDKPAALSTEYGAQGVPYSAREFMSEELGEEWWNLGDPDIQRAWHYRDMQQANLGLYVGRPQTDYVDFENFAFATQLYQAELNKYYVEHYRRGKYDPEGILPIETNPAGASLQFIFNNWWPSITWGLLDHNREALLGYEWFQEVNTPVLASIAQKENVFGPGQWVDFPLYVINDFHTDYSAVLKWRLVEETDSFYLKGNPLGILDLGGVLTYTGIPPLAMTVVKGHGEEVGVIQEGEEEFYLPSDSIEIHDIIEPFETSWVWYDRHFTLYVTLESSEGELLNENWYHFLVTPFPLLLYFTKPYGLSPDPLFDLTVTVKDPDGRSWKNADIELFQRYKETDIASGKTDRDGQWMKENLTPGAYRVTISGGGSEKVRDIVLNYSREIEVTLDSSPAGCNQLIADTSDIGRLSQGISLLLLFLPWILFRRKRMLIISNKGG